MEKYQERARDVLANNQKINILAESLGDSKDVNAAVITRCLVDCCEVTALAKDYYKKVGYPTIERRNGEILQARPSNILIFDEDIRNMWSSMTYMMMINDFTWGRNDFLVENPYAENMYSYLISAVKEGTYELSDDDYLNEIKKETISELMGISQMLWDSKDGFTSEMNKSRLIENLNNNYALCKINFSNDDMSKLFIGDLLYDVNQNFDLSNVEHVQDITPSFDRFKQYRLVK